MGFRVLPAMRVRSTRPATGLLRRFLIPRGLVAKKATSQRVVQRCRPVKVKAKDDELDWSEKSRELFETALDKSTEYSKAALKTWESTDDKPAVIAIFVIALTALYATNATLGAMENVPLVGLFLKIVGLYVTAWSIYRMVAFEVDREEMITEVKSLAKKITGE